jgi:Family of unknown function (DUF6622)
MLETILQAALHTPWWVYLLFVYLVKVGIRASKTGVVSIHKLYVIPLIFTLMAIETVINNVGLTANTVALWAFSTVFGIIIGWFLVYPLKLRCDHQNKLIEVPGSWSTLVIIMMIFASKYYFGYALSVDPNLVNNTNFEIALLGVTGICSGLFVGKLLCYVYRLKTNPHTVLQN